MGTAADVVEYVVVEDMVGDVAVEGIAGGAVEDVVEDTARDVAPVLLSVPALTSSVCQQPAPLPCEPAMSKSCWAAHQRAYGGGELPGRIDTRLQQPLRSALTTPTPTTQFAA